MRRAGDGERARLNRLFAELCAIPSPTGREAAMAERVVAELASFGVAATTDAAGNLLARIPALAVPAAPAPDAPGRRPEDPRTILLCAHLDTVAHGDTPIEPVLVEDGWENAHEAILGADNKAAVAMLLVAARRWAAAPPPVAVELLLTTGEEAGLLGVKEVDLTTLRSDVGFVFDHATPIGEVIVAAPEAYFVRAEFHGRAAHAGIRPEDGRSAIAAAARAIAALPLGRLDAATTANIGTIAGGVGGTNVVPERCWFEGEARSFDPARVEAVVAEMVDRCHDAANDPACDCDVDVDVTRVFPGYTHAPDAPGVRAAEAALRACGHTPVHRRSGGAADGNVLQAGGLHTVNLANGTERAHETTERVSVAALEGMLDVVLTLIEDR